MRRSAYSDAQIIEVVRELETGCPVHEICATWQVSKRTLYRWRRKFGALKPFAVQSLRRLEQENHRLKIEARQQSGGDAATAETSPALGRTMRVDLGGDLGLGAAPTRPGGIAALVGRYAALRLRCRPPSAWLLRVRAVASR